MAKKSEDMDEVLAQIDAKIDEQLRAQRQDLIEAFRKEGVPDENMKEYLEEYRVSYRRDVLRALGTKLQQKESEKAKQSRKVNPKTQHS